MDILYMITIRCSVVSTTSVCIYRCIYIYIEIYIYIYIYIWVYAYNRWPPRRWGKEEPHMWPKVIHRVPCFSKNNAPKNHIRSIWHDNYFITEVISDQTKHINSKWEAERQTKVRQTNVYIQITITHERSILTHPTLSYPGLAYLRLASPSPG